MENIISYIKEKYRVSSMIVCGDYADGTQTEHSLFEAVALGPTSPYAVEDGVVDGVKLAVYVYPRDIFYGEIVLDEFEQVHEGLVVLDSDGMGTWLKNMIANQIASIPAKRPEDIAASLEWCERLCAQSASGDAEGYFMRHWLLTDSVEIYSDVSGAPFLSPQKTMRKMAKHDPEAARVHLRALSTMEQDALEEWVKLLRRRFEGK